MRPSPRAGAEHAIAIARVVLACASLAAVWLDPPEPARFAGITDGLHTAYLAYAVGLAALTWRRGAGRRLPLLTHAVDIIAFSIFQFLTLGPSSPFFVYFVFSLFCGAIRWGWQGTLWTAGVVMGAYLLLAVSSGQAGPQRPEVNRTVIRTFYLLVAAGLLVYLGRHEQRLRDEIERLARWPSTAGLTAEQAIERIVGHAARTLQAGRAAVVWFAGDEPAEHVYEWSASRAALTRHAPGVIEALSSAAAAGRRGDQDASPGGAAGRALALPMLPDASAGALPSLAGARGLVAASFRTEQVHGWVLVGDLAAAAAEVLPLTEIVAREIGASLEQMHVTQQLTAIAAGEERLRVARDLHDGVLQALTGIRLELRSVAAGVADPGGLRERLAGLERAIAMEQRELRLFIRGLGPEPPAAQDGTLAGRLGELAGRITLEWKVPVSINVRPDVALTSHALREALPLMLHEAIVNAVKHAEPSRVAATVEDAAGDLRLVVSDDGRGFGFRGRLRHDELLTAGAGPRSLLERVASLGGRLDIDSSATGSRVEITIPQ